VLAALASPPATKALDPDPFPCRSLRHAVYAALLHFGLETARRNTAGARIKWMFTTDKARAKMGRAHPVTSKES